MNAQSITHSDLGAYAVWVDRTIDGPVAHEGRMYKANTPGEVQELVDTAIRLADEWYRTPGTLSVTISGAFNMDDRALRLYLEDQATS